MFTVAILGASGAVGHEMISILEERKFPIKELRLLASERSAGQKLLFRGRLLEVQAVSEKQFEGVQIGLFSAGASVSREWAPVAASKGCVVIDNTSEFRMNPDIDLIVPEVNSHRLETLPKSGIIANPNCSTIQMVQALKPLHDEFELKRLIISTYQSVSGKGTAAIDEMESQSQAILEGYPIEEPREFPHQIAFNCLPHIDVFEENGYTKEEMKMVNETRKIMEIPNLPVNATCVRVPVKRGHSESITATFASPVTPAEARKVLGKASGIIVVDDPTKNDYPLPIYCDGRDETYVGRIRQDLSDPSGCGLVFWVVSDNLRKGAALNSIQIAEKLIENRLLNADS